MQESDYIDKHECDDSLLNAPAKDDRLYNRDPSPFEKQQHYRGLSMYRNSLSINLRRLNVDQMEVSQIEHDSNLSKFQDDSDDGHRNHTRLRRQHSLVSRYENDCIDVEAKLDRIKL
jgi:hypothetical protein